MNQTQKDMIAYGIQNEESDLRVHVCPLIKRVYIFPTEEGRKAIKNNDFELVQGYQQNYNEATSEGYLGSPDKIKKCAEVKIRNIAWKHVKFNENEDTSQKGEKATRLVKNMLINGLLPLPLESKIIKNKDLQLKGTDILIKKNALKHDKLLLQIKCDYKGGRKELGGTGHLFLQTAEKNPFNKY